ncbi:extensin family protein [Phenylobacterium sp.]|uniref:extensin-like domain-containing protein n=1 Tax=Phenylobacterium sp. TaxID=1871053 RepID=UPI00271A5FE4|nr:extensin family protein [Phenylobacterium sp.]MDO8800583.1 extensin family protein [Phenylobacterium sp.]
MKFVLPVLTPPSAEAQALAGVSSLLLDMALVAVLLFMVVDRTAPPQDLPWKPFSLDQPLGLATSGKLARIAADPVRCKAALAAGGVEFTETPAKRDGFCSTLDAGRVGGAELSPAGPVMTCRQTLAFTLWKRQVLRPAARDILGAEVAAIDHYGTYACRRVYGQGEGRVSEHAHANALDFAGVRLRDGRRVTVAAHFDEEGARGRFLRAVRDGACEVFRVTLSPDYNAAHRDHLHLDMGPFRTCR